MLATAMRVRQVEIKEVSIDNLAERIKAARVASSKTVTQIAKEVGVSRSYWYDIEQDKIDGALSIENLRKIEQALGVEFGVKFD